MGRLSFVSRSRTVLLVVAGLLLVPTVALGARLVSSWQSGSVLVKKIGPLPSVTWAPTPGDYSDAGEDWGRYLLSRPLEVPSVSLPGTITSQLAVQLRIDIPTSLTDSLGSAMAANPGSSCLIFVNLTANDDGYGGFLELSASTESELDALAGTYVRTMVYNDDADWSGSLQQTEIAASVGCTLFDDFLYEWQDITISFAGAGMTITPLSVRVLAY